MHIVHIYAYKAYCCCKMMQDIKFELWGLNSTQTNKHAHKWYFKTTVTIAPVHVLIVMFAGLLCYMQMWSIITKYKP